MFSFYNKLDKEENTTLDNRIVKIRPMFYSLNKIQWNFDQELQNKIRNEKQDCDNEITNYIPFNMYDNNNDKMDVCLYFPCICTNVKDINCHSSNCKFPFSKGSNYKESMLKDGLEIMDTPSTFLNNMERKNNKRIYDFNLINDFLVENRKINDF